MIADSVRKLRQAELELGRPLPAPMLPDADQVSIPLSPFPVVRNRLDRPPEKLPELPHRHEDVRAVLGELKPPAERDESAVRRPAGRRILGHGDRMLLREADRQLQWRFADRVQHLVPGFDEVLEGVGR